jgi:AraC-like DNA-binding protein
MTPETKIRRRRSTPEPAGPAAGERGGVVSMIVVDAWLGALAGVVPPEVDLVKTTGLDPDSLGNADLFVPQSVELRLVGHALRHCGPEIGLLAAQRTPKGAFGLLEYLVRTSPTLAVGLDHLARFGGLLGSPPGIVRSAGSAATLELNRRARATGTIGACIAEFALGALAWLGRGATEQAWQPEVVHFEHRPLGGKARYQSLFRCPVEFSADTSGLTLASRDLGLPMREADRRLHRVLREAAAAVPGMHKGARFSDRVELAVADAIRSAVRLDLSDIAEQLEMSPRTLQYRLRRDGVSYRAVVDHAREKVARRLLATTQLNVPEIAHVLGYSEPAPFHRAFRRWTGLTPAQFRARLPHRGK